MLEVVIDHKVKDMQVHGGKPSSYPAVEQEVRIGAVVVGNMGTVP